MACSRRKLQNDGLLPAIERYDGPAFRVLRRYLRSAPEAPLHTVILSAQFGLLAHDEPIPRYDQRMTPQRAEALRASVTEHLRRVLADAPYHEVFIHAGKEYRKTLAALDNYLGDRLYVTVAAGAPGRRLAELHSWLRGKDIGGVGERA